MGDIYCASVVKTVADASEQHSYGALTFDNLRPSDGWDRRIFLLGFHIAADGAVASNLDEGLTRVTLYELSLGAGSLGNVQPSVPFDPSAPPSAVSLWSTDHVNMPSVTGRPYLDEEFTLGSNGISRWFKRGLELEVNKENVNNSGMSFNFFNSWASPSPWRWALNVYWLEQ